MTFEEFEKMVAGHDLTYGYSDDSSVYNRGAAQHAAIRKAAEQFPEEDVERVWNAMVDRFLIPDARAPFYWKRKG